MFAWDHEDTRIVKVLGELLRIESGRGDDEAEVSFSEARDVFHQSEEDIRMQRALVGFVNHHHTVGLVQVRSDQIKSNQIGRQVIPLGQVL